MKSLTLIFVDLQLSNFITPEIVHVIDYKKGQTLSMFNSISITALGVSKANSTFLNHFLYFILNRNKILNFLFLKI